MSFKDSAFHIVQRQFLANPTIANQVVFSGLDTTVSFWKLFFTIRNSGIGACTFAVQINGSATNQTSTFFRTTSVGTSFGTSAFPLEIASLTSAGATGTGDFFIAAKTGGANFQNRTGYGSFGGADVSGATYLANYGHIYNDFSTPITSIKIIGSLINSISSGSEFILCSL